MMDIKTALNVIQNEKTKLEAISRIEEAALVVVRSTESERVQLRKLSELKSEVETLEKKKQSLTQDIGSLETAHAAQMAKTSESFSNKRKELAEKFDADTKSCQEAIAKLNKEHEERKRAIRTETKALTSELEATKAALEKTRAKLAELKRELANV